jgi:hypothetical protein
VAIHFAAEAGEASGSRAALVPAAARRLAGRLVPVALRELRLVRVELRLVRV